MSGVRSIRRFALLVATFAAAPAFAHHGAALYEPEKTINIAGTVAEFQFVNPHVLV